MKNKLLGLNQAYSEDTKVKHKTLQLSAMPIKTEIINRSL